MIHLKGLASNAGPSLFQKTPKNVNNFFNPTGKIHFCASYETSDGKSNHLYEIPGRRRAGETCSLHGEPFA
jgi:hypothetical protein